jgi:hypothetical protein
LQLVQVVDLVYLTRQKKLRMIGTSF